MFGVDFFVTRVPRLVIISSVVTEVREAAAEDSVKVADRRLLLLLLPSQKQQDEVQTLVGSVDLRPSCEGK